MANLLQCGHSNQATWKKIDQSKNFLKTKDVEVFVKWKNNVERFRYTVMHWNKTWNYLNHLSGNCIIFYCLVSILNFGSFKTVSLSSNQRVARWPVESICSYERKNSGSNGYSNQFTPWKERHNLSVWYCASTSFILLHFMGHKLKSESTLDSIFHIALV